MVDVLFGDVGVMPNHFFLEAPRLGVMLDLTDLGANNAFEGLKHSTRPNSLYWIAPVGSLAEIYSIVIPICKPEPNRQASGRLESQGVDQLLPQKTHRSGAKNDDALLMQANDAFIWPEVEQFCEVQVLAIGGGVRRLGLHSALFYAQEAQTSIGNWYRDRR
jgi:hypothetical protein